MPLNVNQCFVFTLVGWNTTFTLGMWRKYALMLEIKCRRQAVWHNNDTSFLCHCYVENSLHSSAITSTPFLGSYNRVRFMKCLVTTISPQSGARRSLSLQTLRHTNPATMSLCPCAEQFHWDEYPSDNIPASPTSCAGIVHQQGLTRAPSFYQIQMKQTIDNFGCHLSSGKSLVQISDLWGCLGRWYVSIVIRRNVKIHHPQQNSHCSEMIKLTHCSC